MSADEVHSEGCQNFTPFELARSKQDPSTVGTMLSIYIAPPPAGACSLGCLPVHRPELGSGALLLRREAFPGSGRAGKGHLVALIALHVVQRRQAVATGPVSPILFPTSHRLSS